MLVGRGQHLVAGPEVQPGQHAHDAVARARRQGDVGDLGAEHPRVGRALAVAQLEQRVDVLLRAPQRSAAIEDLEGRAHGRVRQRPARAGVQVGPVLEDRELGAQGGGIHPRQAIYRPQTGQGDEPARA